MAGFLWELRRGGGGGVYDHDDVCMRTLACQKDGRGDEQRLWFLAVFFFTRWHPVADVLTGRVRTCMLVSVSY